MDVLAETEQVIATFYKSQQEKERNQAHVWLLELQKSPQAWQVSLLLLDSTKSMECQYYGAVILHHKVCNMLSEVQEKEIEELKSKLIVLISSYGSGLKFVRLKLCSIFAALVLQSIKKDFSLMDCITQVKSYLESTGCFTNEVTLQILTEFPSQFKNINMNSNKRLEARDFMVQFVEPLLSMWKEIFISKSIDMKNDALSCMLGWIGLGVTALDFIPLIPMLLNQINVEELTSKICEVISDALTEPSSFSLKDTIFQSIEQLLLLEPLIGKAISEENEDFVYSVCMMLSNIGETHSNIIVTTKEANQQMVALNLTKLILKFSSMHGYYPVDETCSKLTLTFWYHLQDDLVEAEMTDFQKQFHDAFLMLVDIYFKKSQYPPEDIYKKYTSEERELLRCYRIDIQDTIMYLHHTLRDRCLAYFIEKIRSLLASPQSTWQEYESILYLLCGTTGTIDAEDKVYMPNIIQLLKKVPNHPKIQDTLYTFLGGLGEWLIYNQGFIEELLPFLLSGLSESSALIMKSCSSSLQDICQECAQLLSHQSVLKVLHVCRETLQRPNCPMKVSVRLFQITGYVLSVLQQPQMHQELEVMVSPLMLQLKGLLESKRPIADISEQLCHCLNCLTALFRSLDPFEEQTDHPVSIVYGQLINILMLVKDYCTEEVVILSATGCISKVIEIVREKMAPYIKPTCQLLYEIFMIQPQWSILNTSSLIIGMFGSEEIVSNDIKQFYLALSTACLNLNSSEHIECMQGFMEFMTKVIRTIPEFFFQNKELQTAVIKCSLQLMTMQETPIIKSSCFFLSTYIGNAGVYEPSKTGTVHCGKDILMTVLHCIGVSAPRSLLDNFSDVLFAFNKNLITQAIVWLKELLSMPNFPTAVPSENQKELFQKAVAKERSSKNRLRETVKNFALLCRGLLGLTYIQ